MYSRFFFPISGFQKSFPGKFSNLNWSALDGDNTEEIEESDVRA